MDLKDVVIGDFNEREIREAFSKISSDNLEQYLDTLIRAQDTTSRQLKMLSRNLALRVEPKDLQHRLHDFIKYQESEDEDVRWLAIDLANNIEENVLVENLEALIDYQADDDSDVVLLASDLIFKINPDKLVDKLDFLQQKCEESKNQTICTLITKLINNINDPVREERVQEIVEMILA